MGEAPIDNQLYRDALARHAGAVVVVATRFKDGNRGLTATSFVSVSIEPPLIAVALDRYAATREAVVEAGSFSVSVLEARQEFIADRFSGRAPAVNPTWSEVPHWNTPAGLPIVAGSVAWFECSVRTVVEAGDHDLILAAVTSAGTADGDPLILWQRSFWHVSR